jgi:putative transposase
VAHIVVREYKRVPHLFALFAKGGIEERIGYTAGRAQRLYRIYGGGDYHFITSSCYRRMPLLGTAERRTIFLKILEQVRKHYRFRVAGYVVMPEHFHLLMSEPERGDPSEVMQALKRRVARKLLPAVRTKAARSRESELWDEGERPQHFWQRRFYDFNVFSKKKHIEKLRYMHRNPVTRKLVNAPEQWQWSSYRAYRFGESGLVKIDIMGGL